MMTYQVYNCLNTTEIYEDRLYRCYGVFQENGLVYTAVRRLDLPRKVIPVTSSLNTDWSCRNVLPGSQSLRDRINFIRSSRPALTVGGTRVRRPAGWFSSTRVNTVIVLSNLRTDTDIIFLRNLTPPIVSIMS